MKFRKYGRTFNAMLLRQMRKRLHNADVTQIANDIEYHGWNRFRQILRERKPPVGSNWA